MIRKAHESDVEHIKELYWLIDADAVAYQPNHYLCQERPDEFIVNTIHDDKSDFLLIERNGHIIGFCLLQERNTGNISCLRKQAYVQIIDLAIAAECGTSSTKVLTKKFSPASFEKNQIYRKHRKILDKIMSSLDR